MKVEIRYSFVRDSKKYTQATKADIAKAIDQMIAAVDLSALANVKSLKGNKMAK